MAKLLQVFLEQQERAVLLQDLHRCALVHDQFHVHSENELEESQTSISLFLPSSHSLSQIGYGDTWPQTLIGKTMLLFLTLSKMLMLLFPSKAVLLQ